MMRWLLLAALAAAACAACIAEPDRFPSKSAATTAGAAVPVTISPPSIPTNVAAPLKDAAGAHSDLCTNDGAHPNFPDDADLLTKTFCQDVKPGGVMPKPTSLNELLKQLGLDFKDPRGGNGVGGNPAFALLGHSSALTARKITTIAPTAFIFTPPAADGSAPTSYTALGFDPGEQLVEVASYDPTAKVVNFYVVFFDQACTGAPGGCTNGDLLTPKLVTGWSNLRAYEDTTELGNTIFDCHVCHQPDNDGTPILRMQEIAAPFTHWFSAATEGGRALLADFHAAHGEVEDYGGIPAALIDKSDPAKLAALVTQAGFGKQPNLFDSAKIEAELRASAPLQPSVNVPVGQSATWQRLYENGVLGTFIAPPYHDVKVTDPGKLATMTAAYRSFTSGASSTLPDIRDVFLDDGLRDMSFAPKIGLDGRGLLAQMCRQCHHSTLDPTLSRQRFLVDKLDSMSRAEKDLAIARLKAPLEEAAAMPPALFRTITDEERNRMIEELAR